MSEEFLKQLGEMATQILAFIIFFAILKKYAWGPVLKLLEDRQKKIEAGFDEIKSLKAGAEDAQKRYEGKIRDIEAEARARIQEAVNEGKRVAAEITEKARTDSAEIAEKAKKNIELELATVRKELRNEIIKLTLGATEKLIHEKLTEERDRELVGSFISDMEGKSR